MTDLLSLSLAELENYIVSIGEPKFRAKQIFGWLMKGRDLDGMNNVPRALTEKLKGDAFVSSVKLEEKEYLRTVRRNFCSHFMTESA